jgi:hypothetical protein
LANLIKEWQKNKVDAEGEEFKVETVDEKLINNVSFYCTTQISPVTSFWGGIITQ